MGAEKADTGKKKRLPFAVKLSIFLLLVTAVIFHPTTIYYIACLIPSFVAAIVDRHPEKTMWITIGAPNFAGAFPGWFLLLQEGHRLDTLLMILTQPVTLLMAYGGAGVGWVLYQNVPPFIAGVMVRKNQNRLKDIEKRQKELTRKWGVDVSKSG